MIVVRDAHTIVLQDNDGKLIDKNILEVVGFLLNAASYEEVVSEAQWVFMVTDVKTRVHRFIADARRAQMQQERRNRA